MIYIVKQIKENTRTRIELNTKEKIKIRDEM